MKFDSTGGDIGLAMKIAENIERRGLDTRVAPGGLCASACVLPLAAGRHVHIAAGSHIGVHQAQQGSGGEAWGSTYDEAAYLASKSVVRTITKKLLDTPAGDMAWAAPAEMRESGWTVDEKPRQEPASPVTTVPRTSTIPGAVAPPPSALTIVSHREVTCVGNGGRLSSFQVAAMSDGRDRVFVAGSDAGNLIRGGALARVCSSIPAGTEIAGQWEVQAPAAPAPTLGPTPVPPAQVVAVPRWADLAPTVIPAPLEAMRQRPRTLLDGVNGLVADLFGSALSAERRLSLLGN